MSIGIEGVYGVEFEVGVVQPSKAMRITAGERSRKGSAESESEGRSYIYINTRLGAGRKHEQCMFCMLQVAAVQLDARCAQCGGLVVWRFERRRLVSFETLEHHIRLKVTTVVTAINHRYRANVWYFHTSYDPVIGYQIYCASQRVNLLRLLQCVGDCEESRSPSIPRSHW